jgi:hypothetical protein
MALLYYVIQCVYKYHYSIVHSRFSCVLSLTSHGRIPVSPLIPHSNKFNQREITKRATFEKCINVTSMTYYSEEL